MAKYLVLLLLWVSTTLLSQTHPDFSVTDTDGNVHNLYEDYLNQGKTVVIKIFFVACPPCNNIAPSVQELYEEWGAGEYDVEFFEMTTLTSDNDDDVKGYKDKHGITFPGISNDGGAKAVVDLYKNGAFGAYYGTPSFAVIAPDGKTVYGNATMDLLSQRIAATGAIGMAEVEDSATTYMVNIEWQKDFVPNLDSLDVTLKDSADAVQSIDLMEITNNSLQFDYPSEDIPSLVKPYIEIKYRDATNNGSNMNATDLIILRKHILGITPFENNDYLITADVNGNGRLNATDILIMRKIILGLSAQFSDDVDTFIPRVNNLPLVTNPGNTVGITFNMLKMGDLN